MYIFISYRRASAAEVAVRMSDQLRRDFGSRAVFLDREGIDAGDHFPGRIEEALARCSVMVVVIGPGWGHLRLHEPNDFVRREIERGIARGIRIVPVFVHGATAHEFDAVPESIRALAERQAVIVHEGDIGTALERLTAVLREGPSCPCGKRA